MKKMRRLLAALLVTTMLFGSNGFSYAAEAVGGDTQEAAQEVATVEEPESEAIEETAPEETTVEDTSVQETTESEDSEDETAEEAAAAESAAEGTSAEEASDGGTTVEEAAAEEPDKPAESEEAAEAGTEDSSADKTEAAAPEVEEEAQTEQVFSSGSLIFSGDEHNCDYDVTLEYDESAQIPEGARLKVREIEKDTDEYNSYLEQTKTAVDKGVADARFFDITIVADKDGEEVEVQPQSAVKVNIAYKEAITVSEEENGEVQAVHFDEEKDEPDVLDVKTDDDTEVSEIQFDAESFSVYGVLYTVDFTYDGYTFSIPGEGTILLSALAEQLKLAEKGFAIENVKDVTFSNNELLKIEKQDGDWLLTSLKPFLTEETLTIVMADGATKFIIKVTDAQGDALTIDVNLYDYNDSVTKAFPVDFGGEGERVYAVVWAADRNSDGKLDSSIVNIEPNGTPWAVVDITDIRGNEGDPFDVASFFTTPHAQGDSVKTYADLTPDQKERLLVRVVHTNKDISTLQKIQQWGRSGNQDERAAFEDMWNGGFDGYEVSSAHASGPTTDDKYEVNFKEGNTLELDVTLKFNPAELEVIPGGKYYIKLDALSMSGNKHYYYFVEATADGNSDTVRLKVNGNWTEGQKYSKNWQTITPSVVFPAAGKTITVGGNPNEGMYLPAAVIGNYTYEYEGRKTNIDTDEHILHDEFTYKLTKKSFDNAKTPDDILGEAAEFGIVADTYKQTGHSETNYAVKNLNHNANTDVCGSGVGYMPFYVSNITGPSLDIDKTFCPIDLYIPADQDSKLHSHIQELKDSTFTEPEEIAGVPKLTEINKTHAEIESYVDGLISSGKQTSTTLASKSTMKPVLSQNNKTIDTTQFPDGKTIYVDCTDCKDVIGTPGWIINKLPNQSIVFNIPGENVSIGEFHVNVYNESGEKIDESGSTTDARDDGTSAKNRKVDEIIFDHISFNAYQAKTLDLKNASALFLAPEAERVTQDNGAGWILAKGTVDSSAEWHFYRFQRHYKTKGNFSLSGQKKITDAANNEKPFDDYKSLDYEFELYASNQSGAITDTEAIEKVKADESGAFSFSSLKFTQAEVPEGQSETFYYIIKEVVPTQDNLLGVIYNAKDVHVRVKAQDDSSGNITFTVSKRTKDGQQFGEWVNVENTGADDKKVYALGDFVNTLKKGSLKVTKKVNGNDAKETYEIAVKDINGNYYDLDGNVTQTKPYYISFAKNETKEWKNLIGGKYIVEEKGANVDGYTWSVSGTGVEISVGSGCVQSAEVTNTYVKHTSAEIKAKKTFSGRKWKTGDKFEFVLTPVDDAPMPADAIEQDGVLVKKIEVANATEATEKSFGSIPYSSVGEYKYKVKETKGSLPGVSYDGKEYEVTVNVSKSGYSLTAEVSYGEGAATVAEFTNTFTSTTAQPKVTKKINEWGTATSFTFTLTAVDNAPMPKASGGNVATVTKGGDMTALFGSIEYDEPGTYNYTITEQNGQVDGVSYDVTPHNVTVKVDKEAGTNKLTATVKYDDNKDKLEITNTFTAVEAVLQATKQINNWGSATEFTFLLEAGDSSLKDEEGNAIKSPLPKDDDGNDVTSKKVTKDPESLTAVFGSVKYDKVGTYHYTITEQDDKVPGITYDLTPHQVTVEVTKADNATNALTATVKYDGKPSLTIINHYASTELNLQAEKSFDDWGIANEFTFTLAPKGSAPMPAGTGNVAKATSTNPVAVFGTIKYESEGTYEYTITETDDHVPGVTYDTSAHKVVVEVKKNADNNLDTTVKYDGEENLVITNRFASVKKKLEVTKEINDWGNATSFTFDLAAVTTNAPMPDEGGKVATVTKGGSMTAQFGEIEYEREGEYDYTITERNDGVDGVSYDTTAYPVHVSVKKDTGSNDLKVTVTYGEKKESSLKITNTFKATEAHFEAEKKFASWGKADSFTFELKAVSAKDPADNVITEIPVPAELTATATEKNPTAVFGTMKFTKAGTYEYTITEKNDGADGVSYDTTAHKAVVTVEKKNDATNELTAKVKYDDNKDKLEITNTYEAVKAHFEAEKKYNNWGEATSFTFKLEAKDSSLKDESGAAIKSPMPAGTDTATATADKKTAVFEDITFEKAGTYNYTITEQNGQVDGVSYDVTPHNVTVEVNKEAGTNKLTATVKYDDNKDKLEITNTFTAVEAVLQATKSFNDWSKATSFTFTLAAGDSSLKDEDGNAIKSPLPASVKAVANTINRTAQFDSITFEKAGTYNYTITEQNDGVDGVTYDTTPHKATVIVEKANDATNKLTARVVYDDKEDDLIIKNTFESATISLQAKKDFNDWNKAKSFTFVLKPVSAKDSSEKAIETIPVPEKLTAIATKDIPTAVFGDVKFNQTGTYVYTITEQNDGVDGVDYDTEPHRVVVVVTKNAENKMTATVTYDEKENLVIKNTFTAVNAHFETTKEFNDWSKATSFTFKLEAKNSSLTDDDGNTIVSPMPDGSDTQTATKDKKAVFGDITFDKAGTYNYTITEQNDHVDGVSYDVTPHNATVVVSKDKDTNKLTAVVKYDNDKKELKIKNTFTSVKAKIEATKVYKVFEDLDWANADEFEFELKALTEGAPMPNDTTIKVTKNNRTAVFGDIEFVKAGDYEYTVTEKEGKNKGITYDTTPHKVTVKVTKAEDATNKLTAEVDYGEAGKLEIKNTYAAEGHIVLEAQKELVGETGRALRPEQFSFVLEGSDIEPQTKTNDGEGKVTFDQITYSKPGTYNYTITEKFEETSGYTFDTNVKRVTVTVTDNHDGTLATSAEYDGGSALFTNTYEASGSTVLKAHKTLENRKLDDKQFIFELYNENGVKTQTVYNDSKGNVTFSSIGYKKPGTYKYTIKELVQNKKGYTFDESEKKVEVTVTDLDYGILAVEVKYDGSDKIPEFINKYDASVKVSKTDVANGKELEGAKIQIIDKDGKVVAEWTSTKKAQEVTGLKTGETYTLHEEVAPDGYTIAADTKFTIDESGKVTSEGTITQDGVLLVEDAITSVKVSKVDVADGKELEGAKIQIIDKDGKVVTEWTSGKEAHEVKGLKTGEKYTLHEEVAPDGYTVATDTTFTIDENGKVTSTGTITEGGVMLIEDAMTVVKVSKVDVADGKELEGATIQILDEKGNVVEEWTSTKEAHEVTGLKTGVKYTLRETVAPDGYKVTTDTTFTIDENGKVTSTGTITEEGVMLVEDEMTVIKVSKVDVADGKELEGAKIQIIDENGNVVAEWTSTKEAHVVTGLKTGVKYTLHEVVAPNGYEIAADTTFTIDQYGNVTSSGTITKDGVLLVEDAKKEEHHKKSKKKDSTNTGDEAPLGVLFGGLGIGAIGLAVLLEERKRRSKKNEAD